MDKKIEILGVNITNASYEEISTIIKEKIMRNEKFSFHNVNVNIALNYDRDDEFKKKLNSFSSLFCDGIGVFIASKILYGKNGLKQRITGTDLYSHILKLADENSLRCFFFGGSREAAGFLPETLKNKYPGIQLSGIVPREINFNENTLNKIRDSNSDILFVGLGTPYQEDWITEYFSSVNATVQIAIGSGIEFISGAKKRAPVFFRKFGLEWVYRVYLEPGRLWKRYILGIPIFIFKIIILKLKLLLK